MSLFDHVDGVRGGQLVAPIVVVRWAGLPIGKGRPRFRVVRTKSGATFASAYTPAKTREFEASLRSAGINAMAGQPPFDEPLAVTVFCYFPTAPSWPAWKRAAALGGELFHVSAPDADNCLKAVGDALDAIVWRNDSMIVDARVVKLYARRKAGTIIEVRRAGPPPVPYSG